MNKYIYILINDVRLDRCTFAKYLIGVNVDENLTWNVHLNHVCKKVSKYVPVLFRIKNSLSRISLKMLYNCIIYPLFIYCNVVWGSAYKTYLIVRIQKKLVKIIAFKGRYEHEGPIFANFNFLSIEQINVYMSCIYIYTRPSKIIGTCFYVPIRYNTRLETYHPR